MTTGQSILVVAIASLVAVGCRCGGNTTSEPAQPSNEQTGIAHGLDWLPRDTTIVARFAPGYGPLADYLETAGTQPECVAPLLAKVTATYMVHRYIADPPVTVVEGDLERGEVERCVVTALGVELRRDDDDPRLTSFAAGDRTSWIGWSDTHVVWNDDLERVIDVLHATDLVAPDSGLASLLARLPQTGAAVVGTTDLTLSFFGIRSIGFVAHWHRGEDGDDRLLFASEQDASALMAEKARRDEQTKQQRGYMGDVALLLWDLRQDGVEIDAPIAIAAEHPARLIRFAEWSLVPTRPD